MWTTIFFLSAISLIAILYYAREDLKWWSARPETEADRNKPQSPNLERSIQQLKEKSSPVEHELSPSMLAVQQILSDFREEQESSGFFNNDGDIQLTKAIKEEFAAEFKGTSLEPFFNIGTAINAKGQLVVPMDAMNILIKDYGAIVSNGGTIVVRNLVDVDKMFSLAAATKTPMFYKDTDGTIERLSTETIETLLINKDTECFLQRLKEKDDALEDIRRKLYMQQEELKRHKQQIQELSENKKKLESQLTHEKTKIKKLSSANEGLEIQVQTLQSTISMMSTKQSKGQKQEKNTPKTSLHNKSNI